MTEALPGQLTVAELKRKLVDADDDAVVVLRTGGLVRDLTVTKVMGPVFMFSAHRHKEARIYQAETGGKHNG